jgi:hypothetical protein
VDYEPEDIEVVSDVELRLISLLGFYDRLQQRYLGLLLNIFSELDKALVLLVANGRDMLSYDCAQNFISLLGYLPNLCLEPVIADHYAAVFDIDSSTVECPILFHFDGIELLQ